MNAPDLPRTRRLPARRVTDDLVMLEAVMARESAPPRTRPGKVLVGVGLCLAGAAVTAAAVTAVHWGAAPDRTMVRCHTTLDLGRGSSFAGTSAAKADAHGLVSIDSAVSACSDLWAQGFLVAGQAHIVPVPRPVTSTPPLTACVDSDGVAAVFPTAADVCTASGLKRLVETRSQ